MDSNIDMKSYRRKSIIKTIAIVFLTVLLVLTFFSQTIMNYSLPEVSAQYASSGTITTRIRGSGSVEANQNYEVRSGSTRTIREVYIRQGDTVSVGDRLFLLEDVESDEVKQAQQAIKEAENAIKAAEKEIREAEKGVKEKEKLVSEAKTAYESSLRDVDPATSTAVLALEKAKEELDEAKKKLNNAGKYDSMIAAAEAAVASAKAYVKQLEREQNDLTKQKQKLQEKMTSATDTEFSDLTLEERLENAEKELNEAKKNLEEAQYFLEIATEQKNQADTDKEIADDVLESAKDAKTEYENTHGKIETTTDAALLEAKRNIEAKELAYQRALEDYNFFVQGQQISRSNTEMTLIEAKNKYLSKADIIDAQYATCLLDYSFMNMQNDILSGQVSYYNTLLSMYDLSYLTRQEYQKKLDDVSNQLISVSENISSLSDQLNKLTKDWEERYNNIHISIDISTDSNGNTGYDSETTVSDDTTSQNNNISDGGTYPSNPGSSGTPSNSGGTPSGDSSYSDALTARIAFERAVNAYITDLTKLEQDDIAQQRALEDKEIEIDRLKQDYETLENNKIADPAAKQLADSLKQAEAAQKAAAKAQTQATNELTKATEKVTEAKTKLTDANQKYNNIRGLNNNESIQEQISAIEKKIDSYGLKIDLANDDLSKKQNDLNDLKTENISEEKARSDYNAAETAYLNAKNALYEKNQDIAKKKLDIVNAGDAVADAEDILADKQEALEQKKNDLADRQKDLDKAVAASTDTAITAPIAGTISNVSVTAGSKTQDAQTLCTIFVTDQGYKVTFTVTRDQASRIHVGDEAKAQYFWGGSCEASVAAIKPDPNNAQQRIVDLNVKGDVTVGQTMTFTLGDRSAEYETVVPNSAIREDRNGKYVLAVESRSTPLGTRYTAVRIDVQVAASDDTQTALSTSLYGNEFIITASTKPINAGDLVRLVNN